MPEICRGTAGPNSRAVIPPFSPPARLCRDRRHPRRGEGGAGRRSGGRGASAGWPPDQWLACGQAGKSCTLARHGDAVAVTAACYLPTAGLKFFSISAKAAGRSQGLSVAISRITVGTLYSPMV